MIARLELVRTIRSRRPLVVVVSLLFFLAMMLLGFYTYAKTETRGDVEFRYTFENQSYFNGLTFALYAFYFGFLLLLPIFTATEGGAQIAGDTSGKTLGLLLARPLTRTRLFLIKSGIAFSISVLSVGWFLLTSLLIGLVLVGWGDLKLYPGVLQMVDRFQNLPQSEALLRFAFTWPAASLALMAPLSLSFLLSTCTKSPINAVGMSVAIYLILYVVAEIHFFKDLRPWLFTSYMAYWRELFREEIPWTKLLLDGAKLSGFSFLFLGLAFRRFRRREQI